MLALTEVFERLSAPTGGAPGASVFETAPVPGYQAYFVGKDPESMACMLMRSQSTEQIMQSPIRLENLDAQFEIPCVIKRDRGPEETGIFSVVRCRAKDGETIRYFLLICESLINGLGESPTRGDIASAVHKVAAIFQKLTQPGSRSVAGLFGELFLIHRSRDPARCLAAWHVTADARFDFSYDNIRLEVKANSTRARVHHFSYDQCSPPQSVMAVVCSLFAERSPTGVTLRELIQDIESAVASDADLVLKLHKVVAECLGSDVREALRLAFDVHLAEASMAFFGLAGIPAVRGELPPGVSDVRFQSDLSGEAPLSLSDIEGLHPTLSAFLPAGRGQKSARI